MDQRSDCEATVKHEELLQRISVQPGIGGGQPCIRGTRIYVAIILDGLAEGLTPEQIIDHYPQLTIEDIHAALAYAGDLTRENIWKIPTAHEVEAR